MKFPNWFKIVWWIILIGLSGYILIKRFHAITEGNAVPLDIFILLIFIALMLVPIFSEISLFGIKFKKEMEGLKTDLNIKFGELKNEIRVSQNQTFNATFQGFGPPPPDNKLPELEINIEKIIRAKLTEQGFPETRKIYGRIDVPDDNLNLFKVRYNIEKELKRIWDARYNEENLEFRYKYQPVLKIIQDLTKFEIIDKDFYGILREILSICNYAIHGEKVTDNQIHFVTKNAKEILDYLYQIG
jgi:hypothetical protein